MASFIWAVFKTLGILILPFVLLIRGAVMIHNLHDLSPWSCILGGALTATIILFIYLTIVYGRFTGSVGSGSSLKRRLGITFIVVIIYAIHGIFFMSASNLKNESLRSEVYTLHPVLRLSLSTLVHIDPQLIITDASRVPEDYRKMGLPSKSSSLHYKQPSSGYVHAVDLRTNGRSFFRNFLVRTYFRIMGFRTLRHVGTSDHLHVSLKSYDRPRGR